MDTRYSQAMDLHNISNEAFFSKFHFTRLFKSIYGSTPHQYLTKVRMEKAKLLLQNEKTVTETCFDVGFESLGSFSGLFKRYTGMSPAKYQQESIKRQQLIKKAPLRFIPNCFAEQKGWTNHPEEPE